MESRRIVLVTGANRGLGLAIVSVAARREPSAHFIVACRDPDAGEKATRDLIEAGNSASFEVLKLDVTKDDDIAKAVDNVALKHGKLDGAQNSQQILGGSANQSS